MPADRPAAQHLAEVADAAVRAHHLYTPSFHDGGPPEEIDEPFTVIEKQSTAKPTGLTRGGRDTSP